MLQSIEPGHICVTEYRGLSAEQRVAVMTARRFEISDDGTLVAHADSGDITIPPTGWRLQ